MQYPARLHTWADKMGRFDNQNAPKYLRSRKGLDL